MLTFRNFTNKRVGSRRTFFSKLFGQDKEKAGYISVRGKESLENDPLNYVRFLTRYNPRSALKTIEEGWEAQKIPFNELFLREYFKACGELKQFDKVRGPSPPQTNTYHSYRWLCHSSPLR